MKLYNTPDYVMMDQNHLDLIKSLVICNKPKKSLEIGIGSGAATSKIIEGYEYNKINLDLTCIDNFCDWNGISPIELDYVKQTKNIKFIKSNEHDFIVSNIEKYDFILSDADHNNTDKWVDKTLDMLNDNGILIYHDVTNKDYKNLYSIVEYVKANNIQHMVFNSNSLPEERCERGLLVIKNN